MTRPRYALADLLRVMQRLRDPQTGCPWDLSQDFKSIVPSTLEEGYELAHAIEHEQYDHVAEELGDVLFQVVFYARLGEERGLFSFDTVVNTLVEKLLRRHPHVFAHGEIEGVVFQPVTVEDVKDTWESIKQDERHARRQTGILADVPLALPALSRAQKVQKRAAGVNFDWADTPSVVEKLQEELEELGAALAANDATAIRDEMGDVLFTCVNLARHLGLDAEATLRHSTDKFERRFRRMEDSVALRGGRLDSLGEVELDQLWSQAKEAPGDGEQGL